jgi:hypothetical protein
MLTALAVAESATSVVKARRMVQYEVARIALPPMPAALTIAGPVSSSTQFGDSNNFIVNGHDACGGQDRPAVGTVQDVGNGTLSASQIASQSRNEIINDLKRPPNYTGVDGCQPDVQNVNNLANQNYQTPDGLNALVHDIQASATQTLNPSSLPPSYDLGTAANPKITVVNGDYTTTLDGYGILLVTGNLTFSGNNAWHGLIFVIGSGNFVENGTPTIDGAILVAKIGQTSGCPGTTNCYATNPSDANMYRDPVSGQKVLGSPTFHWNGGGIGGINYNSCTIQSVKQAANFTVLARREITY